MLLERYSVEGLSLKHHIDDQLRDQSQYTDDQSPENKRALVRALDVLFEFSQAVDEIVFGFPGLLIVMSFDAIELSLDVVGHRVELGSRDVIMLKAIDIGAERVYLLPHRHLQSVYERFHVVSYRDEVIHADISHTTIKRLDEHALNDDGYIPLSI